MSLSSEPGRDRDDVGSRYVKTPGPAGIGDASSREGWLAVDRSDDVTGSVGALYRHILRSSELSTEVDVGLIADLAMALTAGGALRELADCTDLASTGGPGSISTMLVPLMARASGLRVAKVGVPGRPAGAVDVLANVPGYRWSSTEKEFDDAMRRSGFAHTAANECWAPGDAVLFRRRQAEGTQGVPALVVASLLAKKLAAGVRYPGFEVRAARHGSFGSTPDEVRRNGAILCEVAERLGMRATVFVTNAEYPHQPWIGRGEALVALGIACARSGWPGGADLDLEGVADAWLAEHVDTCAQMAVALVKVSSSVATREGSSVDRADLMRETAGLGGHLTGVLSEHLQAHGSAWETFDARFMSVLAARREPVRAQEGGFVRYRIERIRDHIVNANARGAEPINPGTPFPDRAGVLLHVPTATPVAPGDVVLSLRWPSELAPPDASELFEITDFPSTSRYQDGGQLREVIG